MTELSLDQLKTYFQSGDVPNGNDFANLIDTLASQATNIGSHGNNEQTIPGIENTTTIDSFDATQWRMVKYVVSISKNSYPDNRFSGTEVTILIDGQNTSVSEYGSIDNSGDIGTVNVSRIGNTVNLTVTPSPIIRPVTVRFYRTGLKA
jgi:hypothetical protein